MSLTTLFSKDPLYRRVKDGLIIAFALYSLFPDAVQAFLGRKNDLPPRPENTEAMKVDIAYIKERLGKVEDKLDRIMVYHRRNRDDNGR